MKHILRFVVGTTIAIESNMKFTTVRKMQGQQRSDCDKAEAQGVVLVKYGGSAITEKSNFETLNMDALNSTASQIKKIKQKQTKTSFVIVHGAGSFGHFQASKYGLSRGGSPESWAEGAALTRQSVVKLNGLVVQSHINQGISAVGVSLFPSLKTNNKEIADIGVLSDISSILTSGLTPMIHGDVVLDSSQTCSIFSGDRIMFWLCKNLKGCHKPSRAVFLTDVSGVYYKNPNQGDAKLIPVLRIIFPETDTAAHDVTGGIRTKIQAAADIALLGIPVYIVQVNTEHAYAALSGNEPKVATRISVVDN
eukprot:gene6405-12948_t